MPRKASPKNTPTALTFRVTEKVRDFYKDTFGSARAGTSYVFNLFPTLLEKTRAEQAEVFSVSEREKILYEIERMMGSDYNLTGKQVLAALEGHEDLYKRVEALPLFSRICLEIDGFGRTYRKPLTPWGDVQVATELSPEAVRTLEQKFLGMNQHAAMVFLTAEFIQWHKKTLAEISAAIKKRASSAMAGYELPEPAAAAGKMIELGALARLSKEHQGEISEMSFFARACLEIHGFDANEEKKVFSTKLSAKKLQGFYSGFQGKKMSFMGTYVMDSFPLLYEEAVVRIRESLGDNELRSVKKALEPYGVDKGPAMGQLVPVAVEKMISDKKPEARTGEDFHLVTKISQMSLFDRACLELFAKHGG